LPSKLHCILILGNVEKVVLYLEQTRDEYVFNSLIKALAKANQLQEIEFHLKEYPELCEQSYLIKRHLFKELKEKGDFTLMDNIFENYFSFIKIPEYFDERINGEILNFQSFPMALSIAMLRHYSKFLPPNQKFYIKTSFGKTMGDEIRKDWLQKELLTQNILNNAIVSRVAAHKDLLLIELGNEE
jgi:hypothetical protein